MVQEKDESLAVNKPTETPKEPDVDPELIRQQQEREEKARQERERQEKKKREQEARAKAADAAKGLLGGGNSTDGADGDGKSSGSDSKGDKSGENPITANPPEVNVHGRTCLKCVKPAGTFKEVGKVVLKITVDEQGNVAPAVAAGTTISDQNVLQAVKVAATKTKFSPGEIAIGTITYIIE
jgi:outer membrane biosynthesis protein TonB